MLRDGMRKQVDRVCLTPSNSSKGSRKLHFIPQDLDTAERKDMSLDIIERILQRRVALGPTDLWRGGQCCGPGRAWPSQRELCTTANRRTWT